MRAGVGFAGGRSKCGGAEALDEYEDDDKQ